MPCSSRWVCRASRAALMPALYLPVFLMLVALIFRGVAFEFRHHGVEVSVHGTSGGIAITRFQG